MCPLPLLTQIFSISLIFFGNFENFYVLSSKISYDSIIHIGGPVFFIFMQILKKLIRIVGWCPLGVGVPFSGKSWIRH